MKISTHLPYPKYRYIRPLLDMELVFKQCKFDGIFRYSLHQEIAIHDFAFIWSHLLCFVVRQFIYIFQS